MIENSSTERWVFASIWSKNRGGREREGEDLGCGHAKTMQR